MNTASKLQMLITLMTEVDEDGEPVFPEEIRAELAKELLNIDSGDSNESND